jgi:prepilin-type N-terminal cleavage/methylation domain-containing protein
MIKKQSGFTLLELLITMMLFMVVTGAVYGLLEVSRTDTFATNQRVEILQNLRNVLGSIGRDLLNSGMALPKSGAMINDNALSTLLKLTADADTSPDQVNSVVSGYNLNSNSLRTDGKKTDQITFLMKDQSFNGGDKLTYTSIANSGKDIVVSNGANCNLRDVYLVSSDSPPNSALGYMTAKNGNTLSFAASDALGINKLGTGGPINSLTAPGSVMRVLWVTYFVQPDGTMIRRVYGGAQSNASTGREDQPVAYNVRGFVAEYVLKDGKITSNPTLAELPDIRQVRVTIEAQSSMKDKRTKKEYIVSLSSTFSTRNLGYDER